MKNTFLLPVVQLALWASPGLAQPSPPRPAPRLNLLSQCRGKVTIVAFIVTTCPHCQAFTRTVMEPLYESRRICALAIAFDEDGDVAKFAAKQRLTFPVFKLERKLVREFLGLGGPDRALGTPQVVVIDKAGVIQAQSAPEGSPLLTQPAVIREIVGRLQ